MDDAADPATGQQADVYKYTQDVEWTHSKFDKKLPVIAGHLFQCNKHHNGYSYYR